MLLGHARGKVGDLVFSRSNGQQVTRSRAAVVKNPQTESQMIQRIILNTVAQAYSRMRPLCDHSFEGVQEGQDSMSAFMRKNLQQLRSYVAKMVADNWDLYSIAAFTPIGSNIFAANEFVLSSGSLPGIETSFAGSSTTINAALGGVTYGDILEANNLQRGDQLTFLAIKGTTQQAATLHYARVILDPTNADGSPADLSTPLIANGEIVLPSPRNTGEFASLVMDNGTLTWNIGNAGQGTQAAAVIVSRKSSNGSWQRSNTKFTVNDIVVVGFLTSLGECLDIFQAGGFDTENALYLNNAGTGPVVTGSEAADTLALKTLAGAAVNAASIINTIVNGTPVAVIIGTDSQQYFIMNMITISRYYQYYMTSMTPTWVNGSADSEAAATFIAAVGATNDNTVEFVDGDDDGNAAKTWLIRHGVGYFN